MKLNLPECDMRIKREGDTLRVFDPLRKRYVILTPEENVRQHFVNWLTHYLHYPAGLMGNEISITLNDTKRRCDTVVFSRTGNPLMIIEYKAPNVPVTQDVFDQIVRYNMVLRAKYLVVSNGINHYCCVIDYAANSYHFIPRVPDYQEITLQASEN